MRSKTPGNDCPQRRASAGRADRFAEQDTAEAKNLLAVIKSELDRLIEVVEEYLQFARLPK